MQLSRDRVMRGGREARSGAGEHAAHNLSLGIPCPWGCSSPAEAPRDFVGDLNGPNALHPSKG